jgi:SH3 domain protein
MTIKRRKCELVSLLLFAYTLPLFALFLSVSTALAETRYVKPSAEVVVRTGQGNDYKIVGMVKDGDSVVLLQEDESYSMVRLGNGKEGWMLKRFLSEEPPLIDIVASLRAESEELSRKEVDAAQKNKEMSALLSQTKIEFDTIVAERDQVLRDYQTLQRDTADVVKIKNDLQKTAEENQLLAQKLETIEQENNQLKKDRAVNWFLAGAGVLCVGVAVGRLPSPSRRRKPSLL